MSGQQGDFSFDDFARKTLLRADQLKRAVGIKFFGSVIKDNPVGDADYWQSPAPEGYVGGRSRGNWNCTLGQPDLSTTPEETFPGLGQTMAKMQQMVLSGDRKTIDWLANSLPYIERLESGWSRQAPIGMVGKNFVRMKQVISRELARLRHG